jgi:hypothetical protein
MRATALLSLASRAAAPLRCAPPQSLLLRGALAPHARCATGPPTYTGEVYKDSEHAREVRMRRALGACAAR